MDQHRVRQAEAPHGEDPYHLVEMTPGEWLELKPGVSHQEIHDFLDWEESAGRFHLRFVDRAFEVGLIPPWEDVDPILAVS